MSLACTVDYYLPRPHGFVGFYWLVSMLAIRSSLTTCSGETVEDISSRPLCKLLSMYCTTTRVDYSFVPIIIIVSYDMFVCMSTLNSP